MRRIALAFLAALLLCAAAPQDLAPDISPWLGERVRVRSTEGRITFEVRGKLRRTGRRETVYCISRQHSCVATFRHADIHRVGFWIEFEPFQYVEVDERHGGAQLVIELHTAATYR